MNNNNMANILKENARRMSILSIDVENQEISQFDLFFKLIFISKDINTLLEQIKNQLLEKVRLAYEEGE